MMRSKETVKAIVTIFIFAVCQLCLAADDTNIILMSDWSKPVRLQNDQLHFESIRGRLLILQGTEPGYGGPPTTNWAMTFVELQNVTGACCDSIDVCFDVMKLNCKLSDSGGRAVPEVSLGGYSGRGPIPPCWVNLPYNSTIRFFVIGGTANPLSVHSNGVPWASYWSLAMKDTNAYFLSGTLNIFTHTNAILTNFPGEQEMDFQLDRTATLEFPTVRITASQNGK